MKNSKISEAYSDALLHIVSKNHKTLITTLPKIRLFYEVVTKDYIHSVANNGSKEEKKNWIDEVFSDWVPNYWKTLMYLLVDKNIFYIIADIAIDFLEKGYEKINISFGVIYTASKLTEKQFQEIVRVMQIKLKRKVILAEEIDKSLLGGIKVEIENIVYDNSFLGQVKKIRDNILRISED